MLVLYLDEHLTRKHQAEQLKNKLSKGCGLLAKLRYCVTTDILRTAYFSVYDLIMRQEQPFGGVLRKSCSENMQQIYRWLLLM